MHGHKISRDDGSSDKDDVELKRWNSIGEKEKLSWIGSKGGHLGESLPDRSHWLPELDAKYFGNKWLLKAFLNDIEKSRVCSGN